MWNGNQIRDIPSNQNVDIVRLREQKWAMLQRYDKKKSKQSTAKKKEDKSSKQNADPRGYRSAIGEQGMTRLYQDLKGSVEMK